ncbi:MAG: 50S ribosomal protein L23 [Planctomycetota bacterium]|nr:MAG: 50S ribosomal protein L23 [Planctomycetota bacterium]
MTATADHYRIVLRPLLTEKTTGEQERSNRYRFEVAASANKVQIREAVAGLFQVKVLSVRTMIRPGKRRRRGWTYFQGAPRKLAVVTLAEGNKIELL